jgi:AraC-like DNA-binding protein
MSISANSNNYFEENGFPITVISPTLPQGTIWREHDLTEIKHSHNFTELIIVTKGNGIHWVEDVDYDVSAGDIFLVQDKQEHYFKLRNNLEIINIMYDTSQLSLPLDELKKIAGFNALFIIEPGYRKKYNYKNHLYLNPVQLEKAEGFIHKMQTELSNKDSGWEISLYSNLLNLIIYLSRQYSKPNSREGKSLFRVAEIIGLLEQSYKKSWTLKEIAKKNGMSVNNLLLIFKKALGQSPIDYLIHLRIKKAIKLLKETNKPISEIAFDVGFNDSNYFSRQFKKVTGSSPKSQR